MAELRSLALRFFTAPPVSACVRPVLRERATVFMLHRLADPDAGVLGSSEAALRTGLTRLRRAGYRFVSLEDVFASLAGDGPPLDGAVAFTVDDGYEDQATRLAPLFAEHDCPVTLFVCTGFLDGRHWFWWDRVEHVFRHTRRQRVQVSVGGADLAYELADPGARFRAQLDLTDRCKQAPPQELEAGIGRLAAAAEVEIPAEPPAPYRPMSWDQLRRCERAGTRFGPHTVTHPILSRASDEQSEHELRESWRRMREEAEHPVPIFCYPNGQRGDFGEREFVTLEKLGFRGAVVGTPGYASSASWQGDRQGRFRVRRFSYPDSLPRMVQYASGLERIKQILRRESE